MATEPGPLLASGRDGDIYEFGPGRVLLNQYRLDCRLDAGEVDFSSLNPGLDAWADFLDLLYRPRLENRGRA